MSSEDVKLLEEMEKKDVATVKGKMTKPHPPVVSWEDYIELPDELDVKGLIIDMAIDVLYINDCSFFHSMDRKIKFRTVVLLSRRKKRKIIRGRSSLKHLRSSYVSITWRKIT